jgi:hypothetical protein
MIYIYLGEGTAERDININIIYLFTFIITHWLEYYKQTKYIKPKQSTRKHFSFHYIQISSTYVQT